MARGPVYKELKDNYKKVRNIVYHLYKWKSGNKARKIQRYPDGVTEL